MMPTREDLGLYVSSNYDGDVAALEQAIAADPALAAMLAEEAELELSLRDAAAAATFCVACDELVRCERCDSCGAAARPGGYVIERVLVENAHGRMYAAHDADGTRVALKELAFVQTPSASAHAAFEREAKFLRALEHPAIPRFLASFEEGSGVHTRYYLAQELVDGKALDQLDEHWYTEAEIVDVAKQVLAILVYLQTLTPMVIHRDIKPANLIKRGDGTIALVDFGAAHVHGTTAGSTTIGTFGYMPIEQLAGIVDATTDVYALGATLLHLLTRQEPWRIAQSKTTVNVSAPLRAWLDKAVAADPRARFQSAKDALAELQAPRLATRTRGTGSWRRAAVLGVAISVAALAGAGVHHLVQGESHDQLEVRPADEAAAQPPKYAILTFAFPKTVRGTLFIDGAIVGDYMNGQHAVVAPGKHEVSISFGGKVTCNDSITLFAGKTTTLECNGPAEMQPALTNIKLDKTASFSFANTRLRDALSTLAVTCGLNLVLPDSIDAKVTAQLVDVRCDQALDVLLETHGLWYAYSEKANLVRISPRKQLEHEATVPTLAGGNLPAGGKIDLDLKDAALGDTLRLVAGAGAGKVNVVIPDYVSGKVTIRIKAAPWDQVFEAILESHGLWYEYRESGNIIRIAPRKELEPR